MNPIKSIRSAADRMSKLRVQQPSGGDHVTKDNALSQRAAQQVRAGTAKSAVETPRSLAASLRKLKVK